MHRRRRGDYDECIHALVRRNYRRGNKIIDDPHLCYGEIMIRYFYCDVVSTQGGGYIQCISVQTLIFRLVMNFIRPKTLRAALWCCPILPHGSKEIARNCY